MPNAILNPRHASASPAHALAEEVKVLPSSFSDRLRAGSFDEEEWLRLAATLEGDPALRRRTRNVVEGHLEAPRPGDVARIGDVESLAGLRHAGEQALARGEVAMCAMAGGMATRMGGVVKCLAEVLERRTFLDLRLCENRTHASRAEKPIPMWLMTSDATHAAISQALMSRSVDHVATFVQNVSLRLTPEGGLFRDESGLPSLYATGHGDLVDGLRRSGLLRAFVDGGGKYVWIANIDNLGASIDAEVLGAFIASSRDVQCEVCPKAETDRGGIPVRVDGRLQVLEEFRLPPTFDPASVRVFNTNTFLVRAEPLLHHPFTWTYFEVEKRVDGRPAIQFERLLQEITSALSTSYLEVPRDGLASRFIPVKDFEELERRRAHIADIARLRGMV